MEPGGSLYAVENIFADFRGRRAGLIKALTTEFKKFYEQCDPERKNLCLYGFPDETWAVDFPEPLPTTLPEPVVGINFARDGITEENWLAFIARHSDSWLLALAFFHCGRYGFGKALRASLFRMINDLPTISEVVAGTAKQQTKEKNPISSSRSHKSTSKRSREEETGKSSRWCSSKKVLEDRMEVGADAERGNTSCGACGNTDSDDSLWVRCNVCERWYHGKCVRFRAARASQRQIKQYECPPCSTARKGKLKIA